MGASASPPYSGSWKGESLQPRLEAAEAAAIAVLPPPPPPPLLSSIALLSSLQRLLFESLPVGWPSQLLSGAPACLPDCREGIGPSPASPFSLWSFFPLGQV